MATTTPIDDSDLKARRESMLDILGSWDLEGAVPDDTSMAIVKDYVAGRVDLETARTTLAARFGR